MEPTVIAEFSDDGEFAHASTLLFPAEVTSGIPCDTKEEVAELSAWLKDVFRLRLATNFGRAIPLITASSVLD
ncbi:hypothetical protein AYI69_g3844, partial [Smittium culicis]